LGIAPGGQHELRPAPGILAPGTDGALAFGAPAILGEPGEMPAAGADPIAGHVPGLGPQERPPAALGGAGGPLAPLVPCGRDLARDLARRSRHRSNDVVDAALLHGSNGLRTILDDFIRPGGWRTFWMSVLYSATFIFLAVGSIIVFTFSPL